MQELDCFPSAKENEGRSLVQWRNADGEIVREAFHFISEKDGVTVWRDKDRRLEREFGPAIDCDDAMYWYRNGKLHCEYGAAVKMRDGTKKWFRDGKLHREDGPAIEWVSGNREYFLNGKRVDQSQVKIDDEDVLTWAMK